VSRWLQTEPPFGNTQLYKKRTPSLKVMLAVVPSEIRIESFQNVNEGCSSYDNLFGLCNAVRVGHGETTALVTGAYRKTIRPHTPCVTVGP
jgi:hypothetical protein